MSRPAATLYTNWCASSAQAAKVSGCTGLIHKVIWAGRADQTATAAAVAPSTPPTASQDQRGTHCRLAILI